MTVLRHIGARPPLGLHVEFGDGTERDIDLEPDLDHLPASIQPVLLQPTLGPAGSTAVWPDGTTIAAGILRGDEPASWGAPLHFRARLATFSGLSVWVEYGDDEVRFTADDGRSTGLFRLPGLEPVWSNALSSETREVVRQWAGAHIDELLTAQRAAAAYEPPRPIPGPHEVGARPAAQEPAPPAAPRRAGTTQPVRSGGSISRRSAWIVLGVTGVVVIAALTGLVVSAAVRPDRKPGHPTDTAEASATTAAGGSLSTSVPQLAAPTQPGDGTYRYRYSTSGGANGTVSGIEQDQLSTRSQDAGISTQADTATIPSSRALTTVNETGPSGTVQLSTDFQFSDTDPPVECLWGPPVERLPPSPSVGATWTVDSSCRLRTRTFSVLVLAQGTMTITGAETVSVGGEAVDVWDMALDLTTSAKGIVSVRTVATNQIAKSVALLVSEDAVATSTYVPPTQPGRVVRTHRELESMRPS